MVEVRFHPQDCRSCAFRSQCTRSPKSPRLLKRRPKALYQSLQIARARQTSSDWKSHNGIRAGIESTISQPTHKFDLRRGGYIGLVKTQLQHILTAAALNLTRVVAWLQEIPKTQTRRSRLAALAPDS